MTIKQRAFKYRFYPTPEQVKNLSQTFGCARFVYNKALHERTTAWKDRNERLNYNDTSRLLTSWKKDEETEFLKDVSSVVLQQSLRNLQDGFDKFFRKQNGYPKFKSKNRSSQSANYTYMAFSWSWNDDMTANIKLAKQKEPLNIKWSRPLDGDMSPNSLTISKDPSGRYFISILMKSDIEELPESPNSVGIDLGLTDFAVTDSGSKYQGPKSTRKYEKKLAKAQRNLARKEKGSKNRDKARLKVARIHAKIADTRKDFLHKLSTKMVSENQTIVCETLAVKNMVKNRSLSKSISDASWSNFVSMLQYKSDWYGRNFVLIDQWYPSTQLCSTSGCGYRNTGLSLSHRFWTCPGCNTKHDRDINAAKNIKAAGLAVLACGDGVRLPKGTFSGSPKEATVIEAGIL